MSDKPIKRSKEQFDAEQEKRVDKMVTIGGREILWSKHWDDSMDYGIDTDLTELHGFKIGERVCAAQEIIDEYGYCMAEEGAEGTVIGITRPSRGGGMFNTPARGSQLCIGWDDMDPTSVDGAYLEGV